MNTPVLLIAFNRPKLTQIVFDQIRKVRPKKLYLAIDGPRNESDKLMAKEILALCRPDWPCKLEVNMQSFNLGCRKGVYQGLNWFFSKEDEGIILEDDCVPHPSFFSYCADLLETYRNNHGVGHISGNCFVPIQAPAASYYFSRYPHGWGWASWSRVWEKYDLNVSDYESLDYDSISDNIFEKIYWYEKFSKCAKNQIDTWDYQWLYALWKYQLKSITPTVNLVSNIGFHHKPTHYNIKNNNLSYLESTDYGQMKHPVRDQINTTYDQYIYSKVFNRTLPSNLLHWFMHEFKMLRRGIKLPELSAERQVNV